jgi:hypothetical protein
LDAIDLLVRQHRQLEGALAALLDADPEEREARFAGAGDLLMAHVLVEEHQFFPAVRARRTEDILLETLEEHLSLKRLLADLLDLAVTDVHFEPKVHVLKEQLEHHHREEEEHLFPKVRKLLSGHELGELGGHMLAEEERLLASHARELARGQTRQAAPLG